MANVGSDNINGQQLSSPLATVGTWEGKSIILNSGYTSGVVRYQIRRRDRQGRDLLITSGAEPSQMVLSATPSQLKIILESRTRYEFRVSQNGGEWSSWVTFKTKSYKTPNSSNYRFVDSVKTRTGVRVINTDTKKYTTTTRRNGTVVINNSVVQQYDVASKTKTKTGETVVTKTKVQKTRVGAKVDTTSFAPVADSTTATINVTVVSATAFDDGDNWIVIITFSHAVTVTPGGAETGIELNVVSVGFSGLGVLGTIAQENANAVLMTMSNADTIDQWQISSTPNFVIPVTGTIVVPQGPSALTIL